MADAMRRLTPAQAVCVGLGLCLWLLFAGTASAKVHRWGSEGPQSEQSTPLAIAGTEESPTLIDASNRSGYALEANGSVLAWGIGDEGELGDGSRGKSFDTAVRVDFPAGVKIVAIGEARASGFAIDSTGQGWSWGQGGDGSSCNGLEETDTPAKVPGVTDAVAVQGGEQHVLWLLANGTVVGCGNNVDGQLGLPSSTREASTPQQVAGLSNVVEISAGQLQSLARTASGKVYAFGSNAQGQLCASKSVKKLYTPTEVPLPGPASDISGGGNHLSDGTTLMMVEGVPYGCGDDESGQIGDGQTATKYAPTVAGELLTLGLTRVVSAGEASMGLSSSGEVYTWGSAVSGALGDGSETGFSLSPLAIDSGAVEISGTAWNMLDRGNVPVVTEVQPGAGLVQGGTAVTISGYNFTEVLAVKFGSREASAVTVNSPTSLSAVSPPGTGTVDVTVMTGAGTSPASPLDQFEYVPLGDPPVVKKLEPDEGPSAGGRRVTVTGKDFSGVTAVTFGAAAAGSFTVNAQQTSILAVSPAEPPGTVEVTVTTPNGTSATSKKDQFTFWETAAESSEIDPAAPDGVVAR
jgi:alpha-tubulin suppressor-like RCC1 family protein